MSCTFEAVSVPVLVVSKSHVVHVGGLAGEFPDVALDTPISLVFKFLGSGNLVRLSLVSLR